MANHENRSAARFWSDATARRPLTPAATVAAWVALVAIAVLGRLWQPTWNGEPMWHATPLAGVALAAGYVFPGVLLAASVPVAALAISNLALPAYGDLAIAVVVYAVTAWPVLLGAAGLLGRERPRWLAVVGGSLACSLIFFFSTNLAHWLFRVDYPHTLAGLGSCFAAALPFYRWMPLGDAAWTVAVFALVSAAHAAIDSFAVRRLRPQAVSVRPLD